MIVSLEVRFWRAIVTFGRRGLASNFGQPYLLVWQVIVSGTRYDRGTSNRGTKTAALKFCRTRL
jgi:hypothetical protein